MQLYRRSIEGLYGKVELDRWLLKGAVVAGDPSAWMGVVGSSVIAGAVAFFVAQQKSKADWKQFQTQLAVQLEAQKRSAEDGRISRKIDIAYKFSELSEKSINMSKTFLSEVAKETAIGYIYHDDGDKKAKIWVRNDANILIGRSLSCDVRIEDLSVSREHCVLHVANRECFIIPLNPTNPLKINHVRFDGKVKLENQDRILIGNDEFIYFEF
jgi:hypothetical protein